MSKKLFTIKVKEPKIRKTLPSELVVPKVHRSIKDYRRKKFRADLLDDIDE